MLKGRQRQSKRKVSCEGVKAILYSLIVPINADADAAHCYTRNTRGAGELGRSLTGLLFYPTAMQHAAALLYNINPRSTRSPRVPSNNLSQSWALLKIGILQSRQANFSSSNPNLQGFADLWTLVIFRSSHPVSLSRKPSSIGPKIDLLANRSNNCLEFCSQLATAAKPIF